MRRGWWALGALVAVVTVGALAAPDSDPEELADGPVLTSGPTTPAPTLAVSRTPATAVPTPPAADASRHPSATATATATARATATADTHTATADTADADPTATAALSLLDGIPAKGRAPRTGYDRGLFGTAWTDDVTVELGHNGCDTRNDMLRRDLTEVVFKENSNGCAVLSGTLQDPYTGRELTFVRGSVDAGAIQIDHVVALSDAWQKGAQGWDEQQLRNFANDPANLQATDGTTNQRKGAGDAATWLPPNRGYWCDYVSRQTEVKATYGLWMTAAEKQRIGEILTDCRDDPAEGTAPGSPTAVPDAPASSPSVTGDRTPLPTTAGPTSPATVGDVPEYRNCTDVWERHGGPILRADPGYQSKFDGDDDGVGCENPPR